MINRFIVVYESNFRSMKYRFAPFRARQRPRQLELNLWPTRQRLSAAFSKKYATMRSRR